jgi:hypothetical protein
MMKKAERWNRITLPENFQKLLSSVRSASNNRVSIFDLFKKGYRRTTSLMAIVWFSIILLYFGITLHMGSLGGNIYINVVCLNRLMLRVGNLQKLFSRLSPDLLKPSVFLPVSLSYLS